MPFLHPHHEKPPPRTHRQQRHRLRAAGLALAEFPSCNRTKLRQPRAIHGCALAWLLAVVTSTAATHYVDLNSPAPTSPYTDWSTAATNIQDAIVAADPGDLVLVTNGLYQTGGAASGKEFTTNRAALTKVITVQSVHGPAVTVILGAHGDSRAGIAPVRCAFLTNGASLVGFTLTNGAAGTTGYGGAAYGVPGPLANPTALLSNCVLTASAADFGGGACGLIMDSCVVSGNTANGGAGVYACTLNNCVISNNATPSGLPSFPPAACGGGAYRSTLNHCLISANFAGSGGGAYQCKMTNCLINANSAIEGGGISAGWLYNCTIVSNTATSGGGVYVGGTTALTNSILFYNSATTGPNYQSGPSFSHCCTTPLPAGPGNFTNAPAFANPAVGDFRLQTNSPCINAGINSAVSSTTDLDGNPRIAGGTVDIGAYELQAPASTISYVWLQQYGLPTDGTADALDTDGDGMANWQEWRAGTNPTNALSVLRITPVSARGAVATLRWPSVSGITYSLERSTNLMVQPAFLPVQTNIAGTGGQITISNTNSTPSAPAFYRLSVQ